MHVVHWRQFFVLSMDSTFLQQPTKQIESKEISDKKWISEDFMPDLKLPFLKKEDCF